jgi:hypothetical protein
MAAYKPPRLQDLLNLDGYLNNYVTEISRRYQVFSESLKRIEEVNAFVVPF